MPQRNAVIREVQPEDDFLFLRNLIIETRQPYSHNQKLNLSPQFLKQWIFPEGSKANPQVKAFVLEEHGEITGIMAVEIRGKSGMLEYGFKQSSHKLLTALIENCSQVTEEHGGDRLFIFAHTQFGEIRNPEIITFEQLGFRYSDQYMRVSMQLLMDDWQEPEQLDTAQIQLENPAAA